MPRLAGWKGAIDDTGYGKSVAEIELSPGLQVRLKHITGAGAGGNVQTCLVGTDWRLKYNAASKDVTVQRSFKAPLGRLTVRQVVPNLTWAVVPSPQLTYEINPITRGEFSGATTFIKDSLQRRSTLRQRLELSGKHSVDLSLSKSEGQRQVDLDAGVSSFFDKAAKHRLRSVSARHSTLTGPSLHLLAAPTERVGLSVGALMASRILTGSLELVPEAADGAQVLFSAQVQASKRGLPALSTNLAVRYAL